MARFLNLPFEMHVRIVSLLSLKDCIAYMQVCTVTHDVVHYVFAHRKQLDFHSVLDEQNTIALPPHVLMTVLYAHTRVETIQNFCLNPSFNMLDEFSRYFHLYWSYKLVHTDQFDDWGEYVGHPAGHLNHLSFHGNNGGSTRQQSSFLQSLWNSNQEWVEYMIHHNKYVGYGYWESTNPNWSTVDIDAPYTWCITCYTQGVCKCSDEEEVTEISDMDDTPQE